MFCVIAPAALSDLAQFAEQSATLAFSRLGLAAVS
jgi:hypothetical protein